MEQATQDQLDSHFGTQEWRQRLTPYLAGMHVGFGIEDVDESTQRDAFGVEFERGNMINVYVHPVSKPTLDGYVWPEVESLQDWSALKVILERQSNSYRLCGMGMGLFERAWLLQGMQELLMDMVAAPDFVDELLDRLLRIHLEFMRLVVARLPIDGYFGGDDWCGQRGLIMGPELWQRFFRPSFAKMVEEAHRLGVPYYLHTCGNASVIADDLMELGLDGIEWVQPEAMDVYEPKRRVSGRMALVGGMGVQSTLPFGSPEDVRRETRKLQDELGGGGGYIIAPAKPIMPEVPVENVVAFLEPLTGGPLV